MNSCVLMAQIQEAPKLRKTQDNTSLSEMLVQFEEWGDNPPSSLRVVAWGNLAEDVHQSYFAGDRVVITGRLRMTTVEREEGSGQRYKERRAELVASGFEKLEGLSAGGDFSASDSEARPSNTISMEDYRKPSSAEQPPASSGANRSQKPPEPVAVPSKSTPPPDDSDLDDIPF
ncbi:MAG: single-stranded DNA-binding protein [Cyanobacteriota bacterium]|nr:single-stranded DNA-binding protein [Cyanobacteriota bacterium]